VGSPLGRSEARAALPISTAGSYCHPTACLAKRLGKLGHKEASEGLGRLEIDF
jgi:hypothetical protein